MLLWALTLHFNQEVPHLTRSFSAKANLVCLDRRALAASSQRSPAQVTMKPRITRTLKEESPRSVNEGNRVSTGLITPRASSSNVIMPSDTVIANNVRDIEVPGTFARQYCQERNKSPSRTLPDATPGPKRGLTLKEVRLRSWGKRTST